MFMFNITSGGYPAVSGASATDYGVENLLKIDFLDIVDNILPMRRPYLGLLNRSGTDMPTKFTETRWGIQRAIFQGFRTTGTNDENYADTASGPQFQDAVVRYRKTYGPQGFSKELMEEAVSPGSMGDASQIALQGMIDALGVYMEREFLIGNQTGTIFQVTTTPGAVSASQVYVDNYGGYSGWEVGTIIDSLNLIGARVQFLSAIGGTRHGTEDSSPNGFKITAVDPTKGSERITIDTTGGADLTGGTTVANNDVMVLSRVGSTVQASGDAHTGLAEMCYDYTRSPSSTFQGLTPALAPEYVAQVLTGGGTKRPISEDILQDMDELSMTYGAGMEDVDPDYYGRIFIGHPYMRRAIADLSTPDRTYSEQHVSEKGLSPFLGTRKADLMVNGLPMLACHLDSRNELSLITPSDAFHIHNGPAFGKFMDWPGHPAVQPRTDGPTAQWVYMVYCNQGVRDRTRWVRATELETTQDY